MKIAVFGGSGFIGQHLVRDLVQRGDEVMVVSRSSRPPDHGVRFVTWAELKKQPELAEGFHAFVNLAGESINQRWSKQAKSRIQHSRLEATRQVKELIDQLTEKPEVVVNGSGMSIYGYSEDAAFDDQSPPRRTDFLAQTVDAWERAADQIQGCRIVKLRIGLVLGTSGGAFPLMTLPYRLFVGGRVGSGKQWHSWIHIEDMTGIILYCIDDREISGSVNCTAPEPVTNDEFGRQAGIALGRPHWFPVPAILMKMLFGEMSEVLLEGQRVLPSKMIDLGYSFRYASIERAFNHLLGRRRMS
jgi:uncharacterized protein